MRPIVSDIHGYRKALLEVLAQSEGMESPWCLGDIIGIGGSHGTTWKTLQDSGAVSIAGNHDLAVVGRESRAKFPRQFHMAFESAWEDLKDDDEYKKLPVKREMPGDILLVHASPFDPVWQPVDSSDIVNQIFASFPNYRLILLGHTHQPMWASSDGKIDFAPDPSLDLDPELRYIINPGALSHGQWGILDETSFQWRQIADSKI